MTGTRKLLLSAGAVLAGLFLLALVCAIAVARSDWFSGQVRQRIVSEVENATGGRVEIGEFLFDWRQLRAEVRSFVIHGREKPDEPPLFSASSVQVGLKIISVFRREIDIESLTVVEPRLRLIAKEEGRTHLPRPKVSRQRPVERVLALAIRRFRVERGLLEITSRQIPLEVRGENLSARLFYEAAGPRYSGEVSFRQMRLASPSMPPVAMDVDLSVALEADRLVLRAARFAASRSSAQATGAITNILSPHVEVSFDAKLSLADLRSWVKSPAAVEGTINLAGRFSYAGSSDYAVTARASGAGLSLRMAGAKVGNISLSSGLDARPGRIELPQLAVSALGGAFLGRADVEDLKRFRISGQAKNISISEFARLRGIPAGPWNGLVSGPVGIEGDLADGRPQGIRATAKLAIEASARERPVEGFVDLSFDQRAGTLEFGDSRLATPASRLRFSGALQNGLRVDLESTDLNDILSLTSFLSPAAPRSIPVALKNGVAKFSGSVSGRFEDPRASGRLIVSSFLYQGQSFDRLEATVSVSQSRFEASSLVLTQGSARLEGNARAALRDWKPDPAGDIAGSFSLRGLLLERLLAGTGRKFPVRGSLSGAIQLAGTPRAPEVSAKLALSEAAAFGQQFDQARAQVRYRARVLSVESFQLDSGRAQLRASAVFAHHADDWGSGSLQFEVSGQDFRFVREQTLAGLTVGLDGVLDLQMRGEASANNGRVLLTGLWGELSLGKVAVNKKPAGNLQVTAQTQGDSLILKGAGEIAGAAVSWQARCLFERSYPFEGQANFAKLSLSALRPWLSPAANGAGLPLEASTEGRISFAGAALQPDSWSSRVEMSSVEILPPPGATAQAFSLRSVGPVVLVANRKEIRLQGARFAGPDTSLEATGGVNLQTPSRAYDLRLRGGVNLAALHNFDPSLTASGESSLDASIRGPLSRPEVYGRLELRKASLYLSGVPNGIDNASGTVLLFRDRATIENLTAETGGGKLTLSGFVGFGGDRPNYRLQAAARQVRVRYPQGISTLVNASVDLTGTSRRSLLSGTVTVLRSTISPNVDLAGLLARSSQPMITPATENELLRGMQFDVRVETAPNARFETSLTRDIQAEAGLRVRGTPYKPVLLGRISITQGEIRFLGNQYTISRGEITYLNPARLEPVLNLDLETRVRGIDVTLNFSGPLDRPSWTYRSDPPLQAAEIIALLAVGRAPTSDPALLARQSERDQSWQQIGASTLVGQALAEPLASRLQRFFGVSRIKIDPKLTGLGNNPEAQLTLEQQVSKDITFTYVTSLAQEQQQLIRVEWNLSRQWSVLAVREENGLFGIEFQYRKQFK